MSDLRSLQVVAVVQVNTSPWYDDNPHPPLLIFHHSGYMITLPPFPSHNQSRTGVAAGLKVDQDLPLGGKLAKSNVIAFHL